ncbi:hypothetical protein QE364_003970 [Nocardioides zeae]|uniref:Uncharacterized protein n=2 Tax=Nocardioides zeae TaxID=1457234 RepID=A0ACC6INC3_9ACTN|nr:glycosyltransferase [Nocardioides zeae]MDQ1106587.1 hypothetical protein [Nocardioides zeae]MDR6173734.1 hypothetical protein [Nocardioides zeae]MDR6212236.1 hypothetical protein [Nocardioides zeae]
MSAGLRVGWYVHHHGHGHLHRALAVATVLAADGAEVTVLGSRPAEPHPAVAAWVALPRDDGGEVRAVTANGTLHWAPRHHDGLRARMHAISAWIATARPDVVVCDVSQEVALLCRLHGVPVVSVVQPGDRSDAPHLTGLRAADVLVACWPAAAGMLVEGLPPEVAARVVPVGGLSRFPVTAGTVTRRDEVVVLGGSGGAAWTSDQLDGLRREAGRPVRELGGAGGWDPDPAAALAAAAVVVVHAGQNALAEVAAARVPAVVVPAARPHDEQHATARALAAGDWPVRVLPALEHDDWPALLAEVAALDGRRWAGWCDGGAATRFADVVRAVGGRR